ncbi:hypothetical protein AB0J14_34890 [Micromonospora arborensis]|uniref:hypothetical protein n=1 Tax=Micromonospora arborensis TaxID=2116518 RepID=UPI00340521C2
MHERVDHTGLTEQRRKWLLPVGDGVVTQLRMDCALTLVVVSWIAVRIEGELFCGAPGAEGRFDPFGFDRSGTVA